MDKARDHRLQFNFQAQASGMPETISCLAFQNPVKFPAVQASGSGNTNIFCLTFENLSFFLLDFISLNPSPFFSRKFGKLACEKDWDSFDM